MGEWENGRMGALASRAIIPGRRDSHEAQQQPTRSLRIVHSNRDAPTQTTEETRIRGNVD